jgi:hypothetical protein
LVYYYENILGKLGNMTYKTSFLGLTKKGWSLDGLDGNWVFELMECICKGHHFTYIKGINIQA